MNMFHLQIVTPDGLLFDGNAQKLIARTIEGDVGILSGHADYVSPLAIGAARITNENGNVREAACAGGLISVKNNIVRLVGNTFEWAEDIDIERARAAETKARREIESASDYKEKAAEIKLKRALTRIRVSKNVNGR